MKKGFLLSVFALLFSQFLFAHDFIVDGICYNIVSEEYKLCEVTYFKQESGAIKSNFYGSPAKVGGLCKKFSQSNRRKTLNQ